MGSLLKYSLQAAAGPAKRYFVVFNKITSYLKPEAITSREEYCGTGLNPEFGRVPAPCQRDFCRHPPDGDRRAAGRFQANPRRTASFHQI
jgi:hypothetical protein